jgi:hypothetical protein
MASAPVVCSTGWAPPPAGDVVAAFVVAGTVAATVVAAVLLRRRRQRATLPVPLPRDASTVQRFVSQDFDAATPASPAASPAAAVPIVWARVRALVPRAAIISVGVTAFAVVAAVILFASRPMSYAVCSQKIDFTNVLSSQSALALITVAARNSNYFHIDA